MKISETFASIQGEGTLAGVPSLFIRTSGCNLRCVWCDTPYTSWQPEGEDWSVERLLECVAGYPHYRHVVLTGGEPMIFDEAGRLTRELAARGLHVSVETAGTVFRDLACHLMSISPKLSNSTPHEREDGRWAAAHEKLRYQPEVLWRLMSSYEYQFKFVVKDPPDLEEVKQVVRTIGVDAGKVLLMPEGVDPAHLRARSEWIVEACKAEGYRFSPRLHVMIWGNRRGV